MYSCALQNLVKTEQVVQNIQFINWQIKDYKQDVSSYIERILHQTTDLKTKLEYMGGGSIPKYVQLLFVERLSYYLCEQLIDAYSKVKKCNKQGRESMLLDLNYLRGQLETQLGKSLPCFDQVDSFINAFFL